MTRAQLVQEVIDRGYDYVKTSRIQGFVQRAYEEICSRYPWGFLEEEISGKAPLEIADLRQVLYVLDTTRQVRLQGTSKAWLSAYFSDLDTASGAAVYWYPDGDTLRVYPSTADALSVRYIKRPAVMADGDEPLIPAEWQYLIVDRAVADCLKDDDEYGEAQTLRGEVNTGIVQMISALRVNLQGSRVIQRGGWSGDYV